MKWFDKWFYKRVKQAWESKHLYAIQEEMPSNTIPGRDDSVNAKSSIRFTIYPASGGYVVEHARHDRHKDGEGPTLTIINHGDDLGTALSHIVTLESLKQ